jgi:gamma-glutamyltranspeptidase
VESVEVVLCSFVARMGNTNLLVSSHHDISGVVLTHPDYRETAPAAAHRDMYKDNILGSVWSGLASGVPGDIAGLEYLHDKYGVSLQLSTDTHC